jgi:hypothetical protein
MRSTAGTFGAGLCAALLHGLAVFGQSNEPAWPANVRGFVPPAAGEHPRLFLRKTGGSELRRRAATPEGKAIVERLRFLLNGSDGRSLPSVYNPNRGPQQRDESANAADGALPGRAFTLWHACGYGMLYQLTGEKFYADLGRQCAERILEGQRDRDNRYSFRHPFGVLCAGPSLGALAMGYDLCYDGWDAGFRGKVALAIQNYDEGSFMSLGDLARGGRHVPGKNHWGGQVGGAALALLAIRGDPGVDAARVETMLEENAKAMRRQLEEGFDDRGFYREGNGPGGIAADTAYVPALQAWRVAGGRDYVTPRPHASWILALKVHDLYELRGRPWCMNRNLGYGPSYGTGNFSPWAVEEAPSDRTELSRGGQFAQGFGAVDEALKPAALWVFNHFVEPDPARRTFDTVSPYPHRAALALINWPIGVRERNPAELMPRVVRGQSGYVSVRNRWKDGDDCGVSLLSRSPVMAWGMGVRCDFSQWPGPTPSFWSESADGSIVFSNAKGEGYIAVDFTRKSGCDMLIALAGKCRGKDYSLEGEKGATMLATTHTLGEHEVQVRTWVRGKQPDRAVNGLALKVGGQTIRFDGERFELGR